MRAGLIFLCTMTLIGGLSACSSPKSPEPLARKSALAASRAAAEASMAGQWRRAASLWREAAQGATALDDWSAAGSALLGQAQAEAQQGQSAEAAATLELLLGAAWYPVKLQAEAQYQYALLRFAQGNLADGLGRLDTAAKMLPADASLLAAIANARGRAAQMQGDWAAVRSHADTALRIDSIDPAERANAQRLRGMALLHLGDLAAAEVALSQALSLDQQLARSGAIAADLRGLAELAQQQGRPDAAVLTQRARAVCLAAGTACAP